MIGFGVVFVAVMWIVSGLAALAVLGGEAYLRGRGAAVARRVATIAAWLPLATATVGSRTGATP